MVQQLIIIGASGSFDVKRLEKIVQMLCEDGLSVRHSSVRYNGATTLHVGTLEDLQGELAGTGAFIAPSAVESPASAEVTLGTVNENVLQVLALLTADKQPGTDDTVGSTGGVQAGPKGSRKKKGAAEVVNPDGSSQGQMVNEPPKEAVPGTVPEGALALPGSPVAQPPEGGWPQTDVPPPSTPPPTVIEDTTGDVAEESPKEGAEG